MPKTNDFAGRLLADADSRAAVVSFDNPVLKIAREHPLDGFVAEQELPRPGRVESARQWNLLHLAVVVLVLIAVGELALLVRASGERALTPAAPSTGAIAIESTPPGATIAIDGKEMGKTPWSSALKPGDYTMSVTSGEVTRQVPLTVRAGNSQRIYFNETQISKAPEVAPAPLAPVAAPVAAPAAGTTGGWISISAPIDLQLFENSALIGSSRSARIMLPVGQHVITAANPSLGFETTTTLHVTAGSVARATIDVPSGILNLNAVPWADVTIDGNRLGLTPLANVSLPIGSHEVVFSHPQLGERRQNIVVTVSGPNRVSVDLRQR
jgi:serine/threonine-protein kinase